MEFTNLGQTVVINNQVLCRNSQLLTNRELQLRPQLQPQLQPQLPLMQLQVKPPACHHFLQNFVILQLNMLVEHQVHTSTHLRAAQTTVRKTIESANYDLFSNQNVTLLMRCQKLNNGQRFVCCLTQQSAAAECLMLRNY
jgi:hypothetical protein